MTKKKEKSERGNPEYAFALSRALFETFKSSDAFIKAADNKYFAFDIMVGISEFTSEVLKGLCMASDGSDKLFDFYTTELLPRNFEQMDTLFENKEMLKELLNEVGIQITKMADMPAF